MFGDLQNVVPGHPIAGKEFSGVEAADETLYRGSMVILTPATETRRKAVDIVSAMWRQCGAQLEEIRVDHHDRVLAATSHLPHVVAFALVDMLAGHQTREEVFRYSAGGFRDFTRIASGDPVMWRDICLSNRTEISGIMSLLMQRLQAVQQLIEEGDGESLQKIFSNAKTTRDALIEKYDKQLAEKNAPIASSDTANNPPGGPGSGDERADSVGENEIP